MKPKRAEGEDSAGVGFDNLDAKGDTSPKSMLRQELIGQLEHGDLVDEVEESKRRRVKKTEEMSHTAYSRDKTTSPLQGRTQSKFNKRSTAMSMNRTGLSRQSSMSRADSKFDLRDDQLELVVEKNEKQQLMKMQYK